jgi:hypothetical protein
VSTPPPEGYYPQQPYYAPGWQAPVPATPPPKDRRKVRIALAVVGTLVLLGLVAGGVTAARFFLDTRPLGDVEQAMEVNARRLDVGHCVSDLPADGAVNRVRVVPCEDPHAAEVVGVHTLEDGPWPGDDAVRTRVENACEMDNAQVDGGFRAVVWSPSAGSWSQGDRRGLCLAWHGDGDVRGSFTLGEDVA